MYNTNMSSRVTVFHRGRFVHGHELARRVRALPTTCRLRPYIVCVTEHDEIQILAKKFSDAARDPEIANPDIFLQKYTDGKVVYYKSDDDS
jgi:hypothetical protein